MTPPQYLHLKAELDAATMRGDQAEMMRLIDRILAIDYLRAEIRQLGRRLNCGGVVVENRARNTPDEAEFIRLAKQLKAL